jgi:hypothetical protein
MSASPTGQAKKDKDAKKAWVGLLAIGVIGGIIAFAYWGQAGFPMSATMAAPHYDDEEPMGHRPAHPLSRAEQEKEFEIRGPLLKNGRPLPRHMISNALPTHSFPDVNEWVNDARIVV